MFASESNIVDKAMPLSYHDIKVEHIKLQYLLQKLIDGWKMCYSRSMLNSINSFASSMIGKISRIS